MFQSSCKFLDVFKFLDANQLMMQAAPDLTQIVKSFINPTLCHLMNNFNDSLKLLKLLNINLHFISETVVKSLFCPHLVPSLHSQ